MKTYFSLFTQSFGSNDLGNSLLWQYVSWYTKSAIYHSMISSAFKVLNSNGLPLRQVWFTQYENSWNIFTKRLPHTNAPAFRHLFDTSSHQCLLCLKWQITKVSEFYAAFTVHRVSLSSIDANTVGQKQFEVDIQNCYHHECMGNNTMVFAIKFRLSFQMNLHWQLSNQIIILM